MTRHRVRAHDYIEHMQKACQRLRRYTAGMNFAQFSSDSLIQDAVIRNLEILGEASSQLLAALPDAEPAFLPVPSAPSARRGIGSFTVTTLVNCRQSGRSFKRKSLFLRPS